MQIIVFSDHTSNLCYVQAHHCAGGTTCRGRTLGTLQLCICVVPLIVMQHAHWGQEWHKEAIRKLNLVNL